MKHTLTALALVLAGAAVWAQQQPKKGPCDPGNGGLTLPAGFCAAIAADWTATTCASCCSKAIAPPAPTACLPAAFREKHRS